MYIYLLWLYPTLKSLNLINHRNSSVWEGPVTSVIRTFGMLMGEFNDGTDVDKWLYDNIKEIGGSNFSVQVILYQTISIFCQLIQNNREYFTDIALSKAYVVTDRMFSLAELFVGTFTVQFGSNDRTFFCKTQIFFVLHSMPIAF